MQTIKIGRNDDNDVRLTDGTVSGHHAIITFDGTTYTIQDVGSKNGTFVNGVRISAERCVGSRQLDKYDIVKIGFQPLPWLSYFESQSGITSEPVNKPNVPKQSAGPTKTGSGDKSDGKSNRIALAGLICSFLFPVIGLILSIIGLTKSYSLDGKGHDYAIGGIIISIVMIIIVIAFNLS